MSYRSRFKKFGGEQIPDVVEYIKEIMEREPGSVVSVGCDSIQVRRRTIYAVTVMIYDTEVKKGAHVVFFRESCPKIRETQERLYKEAQFLHDVGTWINDELEKVGVTRDLPELEKRKYKYHLQKSAGEYANIELHNEEAVVRNLVMTDVDLMDTKVIDLHADFNPFESSQYEKGHRNKSFIAYKSYVPWLRGLGFRVWCKPMGFASTSAADLLLKG
jgi:predicted RNase H-related nuclease YkuK (DUF458 family)